MPPWARTPGPGGPCINTGLVTTRVSNMPVHCLELELFCCRYTKIMKPPEWYDVVRYHIVPPIFLVVFTGAVQYLAHVGQGATNITLRLVASKALGNSFSWGCVGLFSLWAFIWLQVPSGKVHGPSTLFGYRPPYQVQCKRKGPSDPIGQRFSNCGPRTTSGPRVLPLWSF